MSETTRFVSIKELSAGAARVVRVTTGSGSQYTVGLVGVGGDRAVVLRGRDREGSKIEIQDPMGALGNGDSLFDTDLQDWVGQRLEVGSLSTSRIAGVEEITDLAEVTSFTGLHRLSVSSSAPREALPPARPPAEPVKARLLYDASPARGSAPEDRAPPPPVRPKVSASSSAPTPVASPARLAKRAKRPQPLIVVEKPSGPLSLAPAPRVDPDRHALEDRVQDLEYAAAYLNRLHRQRRVLAQLDHHPDLLDRFEAAFSLCTLTVEALSKSLLDDVDR